MPHTRQAERERARAKREREEEEQKVNSKKQRTARGGTKFPYRMTGEVLTDVMKHKWQIGKSIAIGGFGDIYLANNDMSVPVGDDAQYVVKIEPHSNGSLFVEMNFYQRVAKAEMINAWLARKRMDYIGLPKFVTFGSQKLNGSNYRFVVLERLGDDIQKLFLKLQRFSVKTVVVLALKIIDTLEYIHNAGYVYANVTGSNILLGRGPNRENEVYLADFGLTRRFAVEGNNNCKADPRAANRGALAFISRDSHTGVTSRRGDLESLGYNMVLWLAGELPWDHEPEIQEEKILFMNNIRHSLKRLFRNTSVPEVLQNYLCYVETIKVMDEPNYCNCKKILKMGLEKMGFIDDGKLELNIRTKVKKPANKKRVYFKEPAIASRENKLKELSPRKSRTTTRQVLAETKRFQNNGTPAKVIPKSLKPAVATSDSPIPAPTMPEVTELPVPVLEIATLGTNLSSEGHKMASRNPSMSPDVY